MLARHPLEILHFHSFAVDHLLGARGALHRLKTSAQQPAPALIDRFQALLRLHL